MGHRLAALPRGVVQEFFVDITDVARKRRQGPYGHGNRPCLGLCPRLRGCGSAAGAGAGLSLGEDIGAFVVDMAGMPAHIVPADARGDHGNECFPEIAVFDRGAGAGFPAVFLPAVDPLGDTVDEVLAVGVDMDGVCIGGGTETHECAGEFHPIIGGVGSSAAVFVADGTVDNNSSPAAAARVAGTGTVGDNVDSVHVNLCETSQCADSLF